MTRKIIAAEIISSCFHPVVFFLIMPFFIVYRFTESGMSALRWGLFSFIFIMAAILFTFIGKRKGFFSDYDISNRRQRYRFYSVLLLFAIMYVFFAFSFRGMFFPMSLIALGICIGILVFDFFNRFIKASIHIAVVCAFVVTIGLLHGVITFLMIFWLVPAVAWSRLVLHKHTPEELVAGGVLGTLITLSTFFIGKSL